MQMKMRMMLCVLLLAFLPAPAFAQSAPIVEDFKPVLNIQLVESKKGIKAWLVEDHTVPVIAMDFAFAAAGSAQDPAALQGLSRVMANTMDEGAGDLDSKAFQQALNDHSISLSYSAARDDFSGALKTLSRYQDKAFDLLALSLTQPRFDQEAVTRMVAANQSRIRTSLAKPEWIAARLMNDAAFEGHPYAQNSGGTLSSLAAITPADLKAYHARALAQDNLYVTVAGDITADALAKVLDKVFTGLPDKADLPAVVDTDLQNTGTLTLFEKDIPQTVIEMIQPGIARADPRYQTAQVMNFILGSSGFGSRLTKVIREERGLTYGIYTSLDPMAHFDGLRVSTSTKNETVGELLDLVKQEWNRITDEPVTETELANAKSYLIGSLPLAFTSTDDIAQILLGIQLDGLPMDYLDQRTQAIEAVTVDDITALAASLLDFDNMTTILVGKPKGIAADRIVKEIPNVD